MSPALLVSLLAVVLAVLAVVLNQTQARLALLEVTLNEGLPPGHRRDEAPTIAASVSVDVEALLGPGTHVFLSRSCHACQRLIAELAERPLGLDGVHFRFVDEARPFVSDVAAANVATLEGSQRDLARSTAADPLPYTIAVGDHGLIARGVTPTRAEVLATGRHAGLRPAVRS